MPDEPSFEIHNQSPALPVQPEERIAFVDILRGFAVLGILVANMASFSGHTTQLVVSRPTVDWWVLLFTRFFVTAKFYSLFSFLFGWGLSVQMARVRERGRRFAPLYLRRLVVLLLIGIVHGVLIWSGDILTLYALLGFLLFLIRNRSQRTILILVVLCMLLPILLNAPWKAPVEIVSRYEDLTSFLRLELAPSDAYSRGSYFDITQLRIEEYLKSLSKFMIHFGNLFSMFLLGLLVGKRRIFQEVEQNWPLLRKGLVGGLTLGVLGNALNLWLILHPSEMPAAWLPQSYHRMVQHTAYTLGAPALMLFYVLGMILLLRKKDWYSRLSPLANVGRMALSNYLFQSILATLIFYNYGLGLFGEIKPFTGLVLTGFIFFLQIKISSWWFEHFRYGPVEWFWRLLTYGKSPQPVSETGGETSKRFERIKKISLFIKQFHPAWILSITWMALLVWAGLLVTWNQQLEATRGASALRSVISEMTTSTQAVTQLGGSGQAGEVLQDSKPVPTFQPVPYRPVNSSARGDVEALAGTFNLERALSEIETLTGAPYLGRQTGSPQGWAAGDYLATQFSRYGLQPLGDQGTYFQEFSVLYTPLEDVPRLYLMSSDNSSLEEFTAYQDFAPVVRWYAGPGTGKGQVYWMNQCSEEDFAAQDVVGKVLLCQRGSTQNWLQQLSRRALEHGAAALLFLTDPEIWQPDFGWSFKEIWVPEPLPVFYVYPDMVTRLLAGGEKTINDLLANARPFPLECTLGFEIKTLQTDSCPGPECTGRNILGILPGRDPTYASEAIILGAHYDHMGQSPTGIVWPGANDDASGVAVLLEIARSWYEQGYVPKRSVIFAAWDAEEVGLLGSIQYVKNPPFPLENTLGMIQLDMVGAGLATLNIDGDNPLSQRIEHIAETLGIETNISNTGGSDHVPFLSSGVPASAFIWDTKPEGDDHYHRPTDTVLEIEDERLRSAAQITELAALNLVESEPSIFEMLTSRASAAQEGDLEAFLSSSHPDQIQNDLAWFQDLQSLQPTRVSLEARNISIAGNHASATVQIGVDTLEPSENTTRTLNVRIPVEFSYESSGWKWGGAQKIWNQIETSIDGKTVFQMGYPPGKEEESSGVGSSAIEIYQRITGLLGLSPETQARLLILENEEILWGSTALSQPRDRLTSVIPGEVKLVNCEALSTSLRLQDGLAQLALAEAGLREALAPWLWQGLPLVLQGYDQPISTQIRFLPTLQEDLAKGSPTPDLVNSWAATTYLQERLGWSGLGRFILNLGQACKEGCDPEEALATTLLEFVNLDAAGFETAWQSTWQSRIETAQGALNTMLSERDLAISSGDTQALLNTIDRSVPNLEIEETHWLEHFQTRPPERYSLKGQPLAFLEGGKLLAEITMEYQPAGAESVSTSFTILLTPSETGYYWAGPLLERLPGERVDILYPSAKGDLAATLLAKAEQIYVSLASILDIPETDKVTIKLYDTPASYRASISILLPQTIAQDAWTNPGESIKLNISEGGNPEDYTGLLANQLSRSLLYRRGIEDGWLVEGISAYLFRRFGVESSPPPSGLQTAELFETANSGRMPALDNITPNIQLSREELELGKSVARDAVDYMVSNYGWPALLDILDAREKRISLDQAFQSSLGISYVQFEQDWRTSLLQKHIDLDWVESAQAFSSELAMESVDYLASPALEGRLAGLPGSTAAAYYIAEAFEAYGLLPVGDLNTETTSLADLLKSIPATNPDTYSLPAYFQTFPINYTEQASIPSIELLTETGEPSLSLIYRQDFLLAQGDACTGAISAPLVWGGNQAYPNIDLEGKIILRTTASDLQDEIDAAISHGAAGLILTNNKREPEELFAKQLDTQQDSLDASIPIFEITQPGFSRLLEGFGYDRRSILGLDAFQPFDGIVRLECSPSRFDTVQTVNVLGLLPGSDPYLRQDVIILGAHYDHVGNDPDGLRYSGANDNASGVAVLLEIARLLHEQDYRPKSSVLFVAWGAQELGQVGSNYYVTHPIFPLHDTNATIHLDGIGGGDGFSLGVQGSTETDSQMLFTIRAAEQALQEELVYTAPFSESDDRPFRQAGVPSLLISWRLANEDNLPDELGNAVRPEHLNIAGRLVTLLLLALAR